MFYHLFDFNTDIETVNVLGHTILHVGISFKVMVLLQLRSFLFKYFCLRLSYICAHKSITFVTVLMLHLCAFVYSY